MKKLTVILVLLSFILGFMVGSPNILDAGNPLSIVKGIVTLNLRKDMIVQISHDPKRYISRINDGNYPLVELMDKDGWKFQENRMSGSAGYGYGTVFSKDSYSLYIRDIQYTRKYRIWQFNN